MTEHGIADLPTVLDSADIPVAETARYASHFNSFFGLKENPFGNTPDPGLFYMSRNHREALMSLYFGVEQRRGFIVVTGEIGAGKTTLCRHFLHNISREIKTAVILNPKISTTHLLSSVVQDFGIPNQGKTRRGIYEGLSRFLVEGIQKNQNACIIIDEAQCLPVRVLEEIRLLSNLETSKQKLIQIILVGQPELRDLLARPQLMQLRQRIGVYVHLDGLNPDESREYIRYRLHQASAREPRIFFDAEVLRQIHALTRGIPRLINAVCDRILMSAFARQTSEVTMDVAGSAFEELAFICRPPEAGKRS